MTDFVQALQGYKQEKNIGVKQLAQLLGRGRIASRSGQHVPG